MLNLTHRRLLAALVIGTGFLGVSSFSQQKPTSAIPVHASHIQASSFNVALEQIATQYNVVIGLDATTSISSSVNQSAVDISLSDGTLGDLLNALLTGKPGYSWQDRPDGSIFITMKTGGGEPEPLSQSTVSQFALDNTDLLDLAGAVEQLPEVQQWSRDNHCPERRVIVIGGQAKSGKTISLTMAGKPLWKILDTLAAKTDSHFWEISRYNLNGHWYCRITI